MNNEADPTLPLNLRPGHEPMTHEAAAFWYSTIYPAPVWLKLWSLGWDTAEGHQWRKRNAPWVDKVLAETDGIRQSLALIPYLEHCALDPAEFGIVKAHRRRCGHFCDEWKNTQAEEHHAAWLAENDETLRRMAEAQSVVEFSELATRLTSWTSPFR